METKENTPALPVRAAGLDIVRTIAVLFVISVHFFLNCGYYAFPLIGQKMFLMTFFRWLFMICVPLFMLLTGYLKCKKPLSRSHYMGILPIAASYLIISCLKISVETTLYGPLYTKKTAFTAIAGYQMSWYVAMYLGLMLLLPFLNILWAGLPKKKHRQLLVLSMVCLTALPSAVPVIVPAYWQQLYPITYYFLGAYLREYQPRIKKLPAAACLFLLLLFLAGGSFRASAGGIFSWEFFGKVDSGMNSLPVCICALLVFLMFYQTDITSAALKRLLCKISSLSLNIYLFSGIFDAIQYSYLKRTLFEPTQFLPYFFITVPAGFLCSFVCAAILDAFLKALGSVLRSCLGTLRE